MSVMRMEQQVVQVQEMKTRLLTSQEDWKCPRHGKTVQLRPRFRTEERTGRKKFAGEYYACPHYWENEPDNCGYYVSMGDDNIPKVKVLDQ